MRRWSSPGIQLGVIGALHTIVGFLIFAPQLRDILADGVLGAVDPVPERMAAFWFLWFGWVLILLGAAFRALEVRGALPLSLVLGAGAMALAGALVLPVSGFWLGFVPVITAIVSQRGVSSGAPAAS